VRQPVGVDPGHGGEQALDDLLPAHLEGEQRHRAPRSATFSLCSGPAAVLPMLGRAAMTTRLAGWSPASLRSRSRKPCQPGDLLTARPQLLDALQGRLEHGAHGGQAVAYLALGHPEDLGFGRVEHVVDAPFGLHGVDPEQRAGPQQAAPEAASATMSA